MKTVFSYSFFKLSNFKTQREKFISQGFPVEIVDRYLKDFDAIRKAKYKEVNKISLDREFNRFDIDAYKDFRELEKIVDGVRGLRRVQTPGEGKKEELKGGRLVYSKDNIEVYYADSPQACIDIKDSSGGNYSWCIARRDTSNMYNTYRYQPHEPAFYFVKNKEKDQKDPYHFFVLQATSNEYIITSANNDGDRKVDWDEVLKIEPKLDGLQDVFKHIPLTDREKEVRSKYHNKSVGNEEFAKMSYDDKLAYLDANPTYVLTIYQFESLPDDLKNKYISFGHSLSDEEKEMIKNNKSLVNRYNEILKRRLEEWEKEFNYHPHAYDPDSEYNAVPVTGDLRELVMPKIIGYWRHKVREGTMMHEVPPSVRNFITIEDEIELWRGIISYSPEYAQNAPREVVQKIPQEVIEAYYRYVDEHYYGNESMKFYRKKISVPNNIRAYIPLTLQDQIDYYKKYIQEYPDEIDIIPSKLKQYFPEVIKANSWYNRSKMAQAIYDPDNVDNPSDLSEYEFDEDVPTYTPEDLQDKSFDESQEQQQEDIQKQNIPEDIQNKYPHFNTPFQALRWAKQNNEACRIGYTTLSGISIVRDIEPVGDFYARTTHRRNIAVWDRDVNDVRTYIFENITACEFLGEKFTPKFNFSQTRRNYMRRLHRRRKNKKVII